jgi:hypothetical protein
LGGGAGVGQGDQVTVVGAGLPGRAGRGVLGDQGADLQVGGRVEDQLVHAHPGPVRPDRAGPLRHRVGVERVVPVRIQPDLGSRELVDPALMGGLLQVVPEYAGSAVDFLSLGRRPGTSDVAATNRALADLVARQRLVAGKPAAAQDANVIVVTAAGLDRSFVNVPKLTCAWLINRTRCPTAKMPKKTLATRNPVLGEFISRLLKLCGDLSGAMHVLYIALLRNDAACTNMPRIARPMNTSVEPVGGRTKAL